jgi:hypothetical protein
VLEDISPRRVTIELRMMKMKREIANHLFQKDKGFAHVLTINEATLQRMSEFEDQKKIATINQLNETTMLGQPATVKSVREVIYPTRFSELPGPAGSFAGDVDTVVIRVIHVRRMNAKTDENDFSGDRRLIPDRIAAHDEIFLPLLRFLFAVLMQNHLRRVDINATRKHRNLLVPAVFAARSQANLGKVFCDVGGSLVVFLGTCHASHARIVSQVSQMLFNAIPVDEHEPVLERGQRFGFGGGDFAWSRNRGRLLAGREQRRRGSHSYKPLFFIQFYSPSDHWSARMIAA